jgi:hypothetical protein
MTIFWPAFVGGVICIAIGLAIILRRERAAHVNANAQRAAFGKAGEPVARLSTPRRMLYNGIGIAVVGIAGIVLSMLNLNW